MLTLIVVYECAGCGERLLERNLFCKSLGRGGNCPGCGETVTVEELGE